MSCILSPSSKHNQLNVLEDGRYREAVIAILFKVTLYYLGNT